MTVLRLVPVLFSPLVEEPPVEPIDDVAEPPAELPPCQGCNCLLATKPERGGGANGKKELTLPPYLRCP
jgi:hypothetical protein